MLPLIIAIRIFITQHFKFNTLILNLLVANHQLFSYLIFYLIHVKLNKPLLTVVGPLSNNDIRYIRLCVCSGKLRKVNLAKATLENNTLPEGAFYGSEFRAAQVPLLSLVLPESIERLGDCSLCQTLITEIDLPDGIVLEPGCLANTPMLGGEITIGKNTVIETADLSCCSAFVSAGDGTLVINYQAKVINDDFASSYIKEFNADEGVEEIKAGALSNLPVETLTLSKSLKKIGEGALQNLSKVKTMYINFTDASVLGFTIDELNEYVEGPDFDLEEWLERVPLRGLPLEATIYVPKGSKGALCRSMALDGRKLVEVD